MEEGPVVRVTVSGKVAATIEGGSHTITAAAEHRRRTKAATVDRHPSTPEPTAAKRRAATAEAATMKRRTAAAEAAAMETAAATAAAEATAASTATETTAAAHPTAVLNLGRQSIGCKFR